MTADKTPDHERLIAWVDVETTGLDPERGSVLEVGIILTDMAIVEIAEWSRVVAFWGPVDEAISTMHGPTGSGLLAPDSYHDCNDGWYTGTNEARASHPSVVAETGAEWLRSHCGDVAPLWGGRNPHFDRGWLRHHMPALHDAIHYRSIDETTLRITLAAWAGIKVPKAESGTAKHRVLDDLRESLRVSREFRSACGRMRP